MVEKPGRIRGGGMVVKPFQFIAANAKGLLQPAVKYRGKEYLRIIYGPEYTLPENIKALERFLARETLRRVHECIFGYWR